MQSYDMRLVRGVRVTCSDKNVGEGAGSDRVTRRRFAGTLVGGCQCQRHQVQEVITGCAHGVLMLR